MTGRVIDLNCDLGESVGAWTRAGDDAMLDLVSSASVACGFHAGDARVMRATVVAAAERGVRVGAHVSYPDREGFGRRDLACSPAEIESDTLYQLGGLVALSSAEGAAVAYVKPHGALYHRCCADEAAAEAVARATVSVSSSLAVMGPPGSLLLHAARAAGLATESEGFADRAYDAAGTLVSRSEPGAVLDAATAAAQAVSIATRGVVHTSSGVEVAVDANTLCLHGDTPGAVEIARAVRASLEAAGLDVAAPRAG